MWPLNPKQGMWPFITLTLGLFFGLVMLTAHSKREEIKANWSTYKSHPFFMFAAPLFKPDDDPRSRLEFGVDTFKDNLFEILNKIFSIFLEPVFKIFKLFTDALIQVLGGLFNIRSMMAKMWEKFNDMIAIFMRRFASVFHALRVTFIRLQAAFQKTYGVAASSIYAGLATINTIQSLIDLMIKVAITILIVLVVMMIFLFFVLWPFMPLILSVVLLIGGTALGGAVGGMADTFCFTADTPIITEDGTTVRIESVRVGQRLSHDAGTVQGIMKFQQHAYDIYDLYGIQVSGTHIVYDAYGQPVHVRDHPDAVLLTHSAPVSLYCLITSSHRIPVQSNIGVMVFADWEELDTVDELRQWHRHVFDTLNGSDVPYVAPSTIALASEAVFTGPTQVWTPLGPAMIRGISPGTFVLDADGKPTRVTGIVCVSNNQVAGARVLNACGASASAGTWMRREGSTVWTQPDADLNAPPPFSEDVLWYSLFTEAGTFKLCTGDELGTGVRDFSDVGATNLANTYTWVMEALVDRNAL